MCVFFFIEINAKREENAFNHVQTIAERRKRIRRKGRQRSFGNCIHWLIPLNNGDKRREFFFENSKSSKDFRNLFPFFLLIIIFSLVDLKAPSTPLLNVHVEFNRMTFLFLCKKK